MNVLSKIIPLLMSVVIMSGCDSEIAIQKPSAALDAIPAFSGEPYVVINDNQPDFDLNMMQPGQTLALGGGGGGDRRVAGLRVRLWTGRKDS